MNWWFKVAGQHVMSMLPGSGRMEEFLRRRVTRTTALGDELFRYRVQWGPGPYLRSMAQHFGPGRFAKLLHYDVGAGWHPIVPFVFAAAGVGRQSLMDVEPHLFVEGCEQVAEALERNMEWVRHETKLPLLSWSRPAAGSSGVSALLAPMGIEYRAPLDSTRLPLRDASVDVLTCTGVLAYVPPAVLRIMLDEFLRVLKPEGILGIYVHLTDDFVGFDKRLSVFHMLSIEDRVWDGAVCSKKYYNNRWRLRDYMDFFTNVGLESLAMQVEEPTTEDLNRLRGMKLAPRFRDMRPEELGVRRFVTVLRRNVGVGRFASGSAGR